jgi:hypothetical protein
MVKKTILAVVLVVLLLAVFASASYRYGGYLPYKNFYAPQVPYAPSSYYPAFQVNYPSYNYPAYYSFPGYKDQYPITNYPRYTSPDGSPAYNYPGYYNYPTANYPVYTRPSYGYPAYIPSTTNYVSQTGTYKTYYGTTPRLKAGQICGNTGTGDSGCEFGMMCDYARSTQPGVGVCTRQA